MGSSQFRKRAGTFGVQAELIGIGSSNINAQSTALQTFRRPYEYTQKIVSSVDLKTEVSWRNISYVIVWQIMVPITPPPNRLLFS